MKKTLSHFLTIGEYEAYLKGWTDGVAHSVNTIPTLDPEQLEDVYQANLAEQRRIKEHKFVQYMNDGYGGIGEGDEGVPFKEEQEVTTSTQPEHLHIDLTEDEFCEQYKPEECPDGSLYVQRHYDDPEDRKELLKAQNEHRIWTVVECDGKWSACNWPAYVNRLYYLITTKPYNPNHVICVNLE